MTRRIEKAAHCPWVIKDDKGEVRGAYRDAKELAAALAFLMEDRDRLASIVAKLPKTGDGAYILPGEYATVFTLVVCNDGDLEVDEFGMNVSDLFLSGDEWHVNTCVGAAKLSDCYKSREAAEAALAARKEQG
jgi:hypothetical protein